MKARLSYTSVVATLALILAIGGTTAVGAQALLTGKSVQDGSLTGADIQNGSLTGADIRVGSLPSNALSVFARANLRGATGDTGPQGPAGPAGPEGAPGVGIITMTGSGPDVTNYQNMDQLAIRTLPAAGDYVMFVHLVGHNTGLVDDDLNCGLFTSPDNNEFGGGGTHLVAGTSSAETIVGAISVLGPQGIVVRCQNNGNTTFDISDITMRIHDLG
jgi:hypothetical protein